MKKSRRKFIKDSATITGGLILASQSSLASDQVKSAQTTAKDIVICIFQRGAADGLHSVVPHGDSDYFAHRQRTAVNNSIDLDGFFGLNPYLSPLKQIWDEGDLAIIHAVGSPDESRSHFDAQDAMEYADFNKNINRTGWLSQYLTETQNSNDSVFRAVSLNGSVPKSIKGDIEALTVSGLKNFDIVTHENLYVDTRTTLDSMFSNDEFFSDSSNVLFSAIDTLQNINPDDYPVDNNAEYQNNEFAKKLKTISTMIKADLGVEIACIDFGGWDHHNDLVESFKLPAQAFANGLLAFYQDMGERMQNITILCMTEFGRRVADNASNGTDHGHASVMYAIGKQVNGAQVYTDWPGLAENNLNRGDLEVTTDFREIFSELLVKRLKYQGDLSSIIPEYPYLGGIDLFKN